MIKNVILTLININKNKVYRVETSSTAFVVYKNKVIYHLVQTKCMPLPPLDIFLSVSYKVQKKNELLSQENIREIISASERSTHYWEMGSRWWVYGPILWKCVGRLEVGLRKVCGLVTKLKNGNGKGGDSKNRANTWRSFSRSTATSQALSQQAFIQTCSLVNKKLKLSLKLRLISKQIQLSVLESIKALNRVQMPPFSRFLGPIWFCSSCKGDREHPLEELKCSSCQSSVLRCRKFLSEAWERMYFLLRGLERARHCAAGFLYIPLFNPQNDDVDRFHHLHFTKKKTELPRR